MKKRFYSACLMGMALFAASALAGKGIVFLFPNAPFWAAQVLTKAILILLSLLCIRYLLKVSWPEAGLRKVGKPWKKGRLLGLGMAIGAVGTILIFFSPATGNPVIKQLSLLEFILIIVLWSSLAEEIFIRGLLQTYLQPLANQQLRIAGFRVSQATLICAVIFSGIHLSLIFLGADFATIAITLLLTFCLGIVAGVQREKYNSIFPAVLVHMAFNFGAIVAGVALAIAFKLITGEFPT